MISWGLLNVAGCLIALTSLIGHARGDEKHFVIGADVSMLPELEKAGAVYQSDGKRADAIAILRDHGCSLFRLRLFVDPDPSYRATWGATQNATYVRTLAKRVKSTGAQFLLDIHYSDSWADPEHQTKPKAWAALTFDQLERRVSQYTADVLRDLAADGSTPDMVQVGNEIAGGMLWPDGKVFGIEAEQEAQQWQRFARLINAGADAVRASPLATNGKPPRVVIHIHGGGHADLPKWFFSRLDRYGVKYDVMGLSFYPSFGDTMPELKRNLLALNQLNGKDVLIVETSYPAHFIDKHGPHMAWPQTPDGQRQFLTDLADVLRTQPIGRAIGFVWWYPEAVPVAGLETWRTGGEGLFDEKGNARPALTEFTRLTR